MRPTIAQEAPCRSEAGRAAREPPRARPQDTRTFVCFNRRTSSARPQRPIPRHAPVRRIAFGPYGLKGRNRSADERQIEAAARLTRHMKRSARCGSGFIDVPCQDAARSAHGPGRAASNCGWRGATGPTCSSRRHPDRIARTSRSQPAKHRSRPLRRAHPLSRSSHEASIPAHDRRSERLPGAQAQEESSTFAFSARLGTREPLAVLQVPTTSPA